jgi:hypothetical protein
MSSATWRLVDVASSMSRSLQTRMRPFGENCSPFDLVTNQWLTVEGQACAFPFIWTLPFRNGVPLPSILEISLRSTVDYQATLDPWIMPRGRWFSQPLNRSRSVALQQLKLPAVAWSHGAGGLRHRVSHGGMILPPTAERPTNTWVVISGYQGFVLQRPQAAKYLRHAGRLDQLLRSWEPVTSRLRAAG